MHPRGKDCLKELRQRSAHAAPKVRNATAPRRWTVLAHLLPHPAEQIPEEAGDILLLRLMVGGGEQR